MEDGLYGKSFMHRASSFDIFALPNKVLMKLGDSDKSILEHVHERLKQSQRIDKIVFAIPGNALNDDLALFLDKAGIAYYRGDEDDVLALL